MRGGAKTIMHRWIGERWHLAVMTSFAIAQPLFDLTASKAEFWVAHRLSASALVLVILALAFFPGLIVTGLISLTSGCFRRRTIDLAMTLLAALTFLPPILRAAGALPAVHAFAFALLGGTVWTVGYRRWQLIPSLLTVLAPAPLVFAIAFLLHPHVRPLLAPQAPTILAPVLTHDTPVLLVVFDELPLVTLLDENRMIDEVRYPNFAALAREADWYRNATAVHAGTHVAIPALLTGRYPAVEERRPASLAAYPENLFTWLGSALDLYAVEQMTGLCPPALNRLHTPSISGSGIGGLARDLGVVYLHLVSPQAWRTRLPPINAGWTDFRRGNALFEKDRVAALLRVVETLPTAEGPALYYLHALLPHLPWEYLPSGRRYPDPWIFPGYSHPVKGPGWWSEDEDHLRSAYQRLLLQVGAVDRLLGQLRAKLLERGIWQRALVVVTADHGMVVRPGHRRRGEAGVDARLTLMPVPLLIKRPFQATGQVVDENVETIDVLPTIAEILDVEIPWPVDGRALYDPDSVPRSQKRFVLIPEDAPGENLLVYGPQNEEKYLALADQLATFGSGTITSRSLYRFGPYRKLIGRSLSELNVRQDEAFTISWHRSDRYAAVDPQAELVPVHVAGIVRAESDDVPRYWAIAANGRVEAIAARSSLVDGRVEISAVLPEQALVPGANTLAACYLESTLETPPALACAGNVGANRTAALRFDALPTVLLRLDAEFGFDGLEPLSGIALRPLADGSAVVLRVAGATASFAIPMPATTGHSRLGLMLEVTSPADTELWLSFRTRGPSSNSATVLRRRPLSRGLNRLYFTFDVGSLGGELTLMPGKAAGEYLVHTIEIRGG